MNAPDYIQPEWPAPAAVRTLITTRRHSRGHSTDEFAQFNLGWRSGEASERVEANHAELAQQLPAQPCWLQQVHGNHVIHATEHVEDIQADGCIATGPGQVCAVLTADCLPVLLCSHDGDCVAAVHAGWRGLEAGIIGEAVRRMPATPDRLLAWLGPGISQRKYAVGDDFRTRFVRLDAEHAAAFVRLNGQWHADLCDIARRLLRQAGVSAISGGQHCTYTGAQQFYSYRRDGRTGRQASLIWIE